MFLSRSPCSFNVNLNRFGSAGRPSGLRSDSYPLFKRRARRRAGSRAQRSVNNDTAASTGTSKRAPRLLDPLSPARKKDGGFCREGDERESGGERRRGEEGGLQFTLGTVVHLHALAPRPPLHRNKAGVRSLVQHAVFNPKQMIAEKRGRGGETKKEHYHLGQASGV